MNGNTSLKRLGGAQYFGGWATSAEDFDAVLTEVEKPVPPTLTKHDFTPRNSEKEIDIYSTRAVSIAPIAKRLSSLEKLTGVRYPGYHKGASPHLQIVAMLAYKPKETQEVVVWSPILLSAKGYQVGKVLDAFAKWSKVTRKARREFADGLDANLFYCTIGTFGDKPNFQGVGTSKDTSTITPIELYEPKDGITEKTIDFLFVGEEVAATMADYREQAREWMDAWNKPKEQTLAAGTLPEVEELPTEEEELTL
jgi:hypothetical protein